MIDKKYDYSIQEKSCHENRPLELYLFIDPLCVDCWSLEPIIKKLQLEYSQYFSLTYVLSGKLAHLNNCSRLKKSIKNHFTKHTFKQTMKSCIDSKEPIENFFDTPFIASVAIKAAELQGRKKGVRFLRKLQEYLFYKNENITEISTLIKCAKEAGLDLEEFKRDIHSVSTSKAFQCDLKITNEMGVTEIPTLVIFTKNVEEDGVKLTGNYPYNVYVNIMSELLKEKPVKSSLPPIITYLQQFQFVTTSEIAFVYDLPSIRVEMELKKLKLQKKVDQLKTENGIYWRYIENEERSHS